MGENQLFEHHTSELEIAEKELMPAVNESKLLIEDRLETIESMGYESPCIFIVNTEKSNLSKSILKELHTPDEKVGALLNQRRSQIWK